MTFIATNGSRGESHAVRPWGESAACGPDPWQPKLSKTQSSLPVAFGDEFLQHSPNLRLVGETPKFRPNYSLRGLLALPLEFDRLPG